WRVEFRRLEVLDPQADPIKGGPWRRVARRQVDVVVDPGVAPRVNVADREDELLARASAGERFDQDPGKAGRFHFQSLQAVTSPQDPLRRGLVDFASEVGGGEGKPNLFIGMMRAAIVLEQTRHGVRTR